MKYASWKLKFIDGYGYGPEALAESLGAKLEAGPFFGDSESTIIGYLFGELDDSKFGEYQLQILTEEECLDLAFSIDPNYEFGENGKLISREIEE
jgi:hypothetical protein